jgi:hypothetical protein
MSSEFQRRKSRTQRDKATRAFLFARLAPSRTARHGHGGHHRYCPREVDGVEQRHDISCGRGGSIVACGGSAPAASGAGPTASPPSCRRGRPARRSARERQPCGPPNRASWWRSLAPMPNTSTGRPCGSESTNASGVAGSWGGSAPRPTLRTCSYRRPVPARARVRP